MEDVKYLMTTFIKIKLIELWNGLTVIWSVYSKNVVCEILLAVKGQIPFRKEKNILFSPQ